MHSHRSHRIHLRQHPARRALFGLAVVGIGALALFDNLHVFDMAMLKTFWPLALVMFGIGRLFWPRHPSSGLFGLALVGVGGLLTARNLGMVHLDVQGLWPVLIILVGLSILLRGLFPDRRREAACSFDTSTLEHGEAVNIEARFSGVKMQNDSRSFKGGRIMARFGGVELDLRQATIEGEEATIDLDVSFGGIDLKVPREWKVVTDVGTTMGSVEDKTLPPMNPGPRLVLRGEAVFGGVEIRN